MASSPDPSNKLGVLDGDDSPQELTAQLEFLIVRCLEYTAKVQSCYNHFQ